MKSCGYCHFWVLIYIRYVVDGVVEFWKVCCGCNFIKKSIFFPGFVLKNMGVRWLIIGYLVWLLREWGERKESATLSRMGSFLLMKRFGLIKTNISSTSLWIHMTFVLPFLCPELSIDLGSWVLQDGDNWSVDVLIYYHLRTFLSNQTKF